MPSHKLRHGLFAAIPTKTLRQEVLLQAEKCGDTHQHCSNTNGCFYPRTPVASKQPTCVKSKREVNKVNRRLTGTVKDRHAWRLPPHAHRAPPFNHLRHTEAPPSSRRMGPRRPQGGQVSRARRNGATEHASQRPPPHRRQGRWRPRGWRERDRRP